MKCVAKYPLVSVVCPWYNRADYIQDSLSSLLSQTYTNVEIIIVNDGSSDPRVKQILDQYDDARIKIIHQNNSGFVSAVRTAIDHSQGDFIAVHGAGEISLPDRILKQANILLQCSELVGVGCNYENVFIATDGSITKRVKKEFSEIASHNDLMIANPLVHGAIMFKRSIYNKVEGYRVFFKFAQDLDLWLRMSDFGDFYIVQETLYERRVFLNDGVAASVDKVLLQSRFMEFARQCSALRRAHGFDFLDKYGESGGLFFIPTSKTASVSAKAALKYMVLYDRAGADLLSEWSLRDRKTILGCCVFILNLFSKKIPYFSKFLSLVLEKFGFYSAKHSSKIPFFKKN